MYRARFSRHTFPVTSAALLFLVAMAGSARAENLPQMRPAGLAHDPKALLNAIDTEGLMKKGQKDGMIRFYCAVSSGGWCGGMATFGGTPGSELLAKEVLRHSESEHPGFIPAVYHGHTTSALVCGTVVFFIKENQPHLRIYLNIEAEHVAHGDDFIAPQPIYVHDQKFRGFQWPNQGVGSSGVVMVRLNVDATGKVTGSKLVLEKPEGRGFAAEVMGTIGDAIFTPAYSQGQPVASTTTFPIIFKSIGGARWAPG